MRPNSVAITTAVLFQAGPSAVFMASSAASSACKRRASWPSAAPSSTWVSQPAGFEARRRADRRRGQQFARALEQAA